ncbi:MAG TPA: Hsp70 family protein, partial [Anaerolineaceae bacterium]|nr:Hsp70 family protein [Anaerolineaceae bacterium]
YQETLRRNQRSDIDDEIRQLSNAILIECERVKEKLSFAESADLAVMNPDTGAMIEATFTRDEFERLLDEHELFAEINRTVRAALNSARERGYDEDSIQAVLLVGGSSQIPAVQRALRQMFDRERVMAGRPLDAVARGGAAFVAGVDFYDHIQHDYAIRYVNPQIGGYDYRIIVSRGTPYPTPSPVAHLTVKATYTGQTTLGLAIYEMGEKRLRQASQPLELVFDPSGAARIMRVSVDEEDRRTTFWMNETNPTFLEAAPPAEQGESRFEVEFNIDEHKRLLISARDIKTGLLTHRDYPVVKLT